MPIVDAFIACYNGTWQNPKPTFVKDMPGKLLIACDEIIPAALNCIEGPLEPGDTRFFPHFVYHEGLKGADVLIVVKAHRYASRVENAPERTIAIQRSLRQLIPHKEIEVSIDLCEMTWAGVSKKYSTESNVDMSLEAAFNRATNQLLAPYMR